MTTKRISALPAQVDLQGLPAAWLRAVLLAFAPPEADAALDAQLADLHAEWLAVRERSRLRAAWLGLAIRAHLLTGAAYYVCLSLGVPALRNSAIFVVAGYITLALFLGLASLIAPRPAPPPIPAVVIDFEFTPPKLPAPPPQRTSRPVRPVPPPDLPRGGTPIEVDRPTFVEPPRGPGDGHGPGWGDVQPPGLVPPTLPKNFMCLPIARTEPDYPPGALRLGIEGSVVVEVGIDRSGSVSSAEVLQAEPAGYFEESVLRAVRRWRYRVSGDAATSCERAQVRLRFELPAGAR
jgi:protein TonB